MTENIEIIIKDTITEEDLLGFEQTYNTAVKENAVTPEVRFEYGWCLIRSNYKDDVRKGVALLEGLCETNMDQRDFLFFISIGYYKLDDYNKALKYVKRLLMIEPNNQQALSLEGLIKEKVKSRGLMGMAMVAGVAGLFGVVVGAALSRK